MYFSTLCTRVLKYISGEPGWVSIFSNMHFSTKPKVLKYLIWISLVYNTILLGLQLFLILKLFIYNCNYNFVFVLHVKYKFRGGAGCVKVKLFIFRQSPYRYNTDLVLFHIDYVLLKETTDIIIE